MLVSRSELSARNELPASSKVPGGENGPLAHSAMPELAHLPRLQTYLVHNMEVVNLGGPGKSRRKVPTCCKRPPRLGVQTPATPAPRQNCDSSCSPECRISVQTFDGKGA